MEDLLKTFKMVVSSEIGVAFEGVQKSHEELQTLLPTPDLYLLAR